MDNSKFHANNRTFINGKRMLKRLMGIPNGTKLSNEDACSMFGFITGVMTGCGFEIKCWVRDYQLFRGLFNPDWATEYSKFMEWQAAGRTVWVAFDEEKGKQYFEHLQSPSGLTYSKEVCQGNGG